MLGSLPWIPAVEVAVGSVVFGLVAVYVFGVTACVTGLAGVGLARFAGPRWDDRTRLE